MYTVEIFCNSIFLKNHWTWTWKISNCVTGVTGLRLTLWYNGPESEKRSNYLTGLWLILWYDGMRLEKYSEYLARFGLMLRYIGLGLEKEIGQLSGLWLILA